MIGKIKWAPDICKYGGGGVNQELGQFGTGSFWGPSISLALGHIGLRVGMAAWTKHRDVGALGGHEYDWYHQVISCSFGSKEGQILNSTVHGVEEAEPAEWTEGWLGEQTERVVFWKLREQNPEGVWAIVSIAAAGEPGRRELRRVRCLTFTGL